MFHVPADVNLVMLHGNEKDFCFCIQGLRINQQSGLAWDTEEGFYVAAKFARCLHLKDEEWLGLLCRWRVFFPCC